MQALYGWSLEWFEEGEQWVSHKKKNLRAIFKSTDIVAI
jgi:hypothetical protein